jgi:hypothetical protein
VSYLYVDPGAALRFPFTEALRANAELRFLYAFSAGQIQDAAQYGSSTVLGFDVDAGLELGLGDSFLLRVGARFLGFYERFSGNGAKTDRGGNQMQDVSSAFDRYLGGYLTAGYTF